MMKKLLIGVAAVVVLLVAAVVAAPFLIPVDTLRDQAVAQVRNATGRELTVGGDVRLSLFPRLEIEVGDVAFANAPGAEEAEMASLSRLELQLELLPLLSGEVAVDSFVLVEPVIRLEVDPDGRPNWQFGPGGETATPSGEGAAPGGLPVSDIRLGDIRLVNGTVVYADARSGTEERVDQIDMTVSLPDLDSPLAAEGKVDWREKTIDMTVSVAEPRSLIEGRTSGVEVRIGSELINFSYAGQAANAETLKLDGGVEVQVTSLRDLAAWAGQPIEAAGDGLGPFRISGKVALAGPEIGFTEAEIGLDAIEARGEVKLDTGGAEPSLQGRLDVGRLDLNPYLPPELSGGQPAGTSQAPTDPAAADWSDEPIDFSALKAANVDFDLTVESILMRKVEIGRGAVSVRLQDGKLAARLTELNLYGGTGEGQIDIDATATVPAVAKTFKLTGIQAEPLLRDAADFDRLEGGGNVELSVTTAGGSQKAMVQALDGQGAVSFVDGAIRGINLAAMIRNVRSAFLDPSARAAQKTDFTELSGTFTITDGILENTDLAMKSPLLRLEGAGTADLPAKTLDYRIEPKVAATIEGQGGSEQTSGVMVPVLVTGPWHNLSYRPDLGGLVKEQIQDPARAVDALKDALPGLVKPQSPDSGPAEAPSPAPANPLDTLKGILGGGRN